MVLFYITLLKWTLYVLSSFYFRKQYYNEYILAEDSDLGLSEKGNSGALGHMLFFHLFFELTVHCPVSV